MFVAGNQHDLRVLLGEFPGHHPAKTARCSCDNNYLVFKKFKIIGNQDLPSATIAVFYLSFTTRKKNQ
jgi:hypothetical protein